MDTTQKLILAVFALGGLLFSMLITRVIGSKRRRDARRREKAWRARLAGPTEELADLLLGCDLFDAALPHGRLCDDPQLARFLACVRAHDYLAAWELCRVESLEGFIAHSEQRMGQRSRPLVMDYGYLSEVFHELVRRAPAATGTPYR